MIRDEIAKSPVLRDYFYDWGSRLYFFSSEIDFYDTTISPTYNYALMYQRGARIVLASGLFLTGVLAGVSMNAPGEAQSKPLFNLVGKRVYVAGHAGMVGAALLRRRKSESCTILTVDHAALDLNPPSGNGATDR